MYCPKDLQPCIDSLCRDTSRCFDVDEAMLVPCPGCKELIACDGSEYELCTCERGKAMNNNYEFPTAKRYPRWLAWLLRWLQRKCRHKTMKADILEGCAGVYAVRWCETCGAFNVVVDGTPNGLPRMCEPTWEA